MFLKVGHFATYPHGADCGFATDVRVCARYYRLDFREQVSSHFDGGDVAESAEGEADDVLVGMIQVATRCLVC